MAGNEATPDGRRPGPDKTEPRPGQPWPRGPPRFWAMAGDSRKQSPWGSALKRGGKARW